MGTDTTYIELGVPLAEAYKKVLSSQHAREGIGSEVMAYRINAQTAFGLDTPGSSRSSGTLPLELFAMNASTPLAGPFIQELRQVVLNNLSLGIAELATLYSRSNETNYFDIDSIVRSFRHPESCKSVSVSPKLFSDSKQQLEDSFVVPSGFELIWLEVMREEENG